MERQFIAWLAEHLPPHPRLRLGPGDDAAVLRMAQSVDCVVTVDLLTDGVDFHLAEIDPRRAGRKALAANLSDLAAMAAKPLAGVVALALPSAGAGELAVALYEGLLPLAERYELAIAGGDTNTWNGPLAISITLLGELTGRGALRRDGARPGDRALVTGSFGGSILAKHLDFEPRVGEALTLHARYALHAGTDVSDGLSCDLAHILQSSGVGAVLQAANVPIDPAAFRLAERLGDGSTPLEHALGDGEDFELILAVPPEEARRMVAEQPLSVALSDIGEFVAEQGLWIEDDQGRRRLSPRGWEHF